LRQLIANSEGVTVQSVPSPSVQAGQVLVRVAYSAVSIGTELAALRPSEPSSAPTLAARAEAQVELVRTRLHYAWKNPARAFTRARQIALRRLESRLRPVTDAGPKPSADAGGIRGWALGYSAAGHVVSVGAGVDDLVPGDAVACAGAGYANHAELVSVPRNLVSRVPAGCDLRWAATTTLGAIALQGVRRGRPQIGESACVLGLGLLGQLSAQMLKASGCTVLTHDPTAERVERSLRGGAHAGSAAAEELRALVRDLTLGRGVDLTVICAAARSNEVALLAAQLTRAKGRLVIVGDIGLELDRAALYKKELDVLMSTSYGPGRYDPSYEEQGLDYPYAHVRWTANRNMQAYLDLVAAGTLHVEPLIDRVVPAAAAPALYEELRRTRPGPLGVLLDHGSPDREAASARVVEITRQPAPAAGKVEYALVGIGAFGTSMLVPQLERMSDRFRLRAVVSRRAVEAGNFATSHGAPVLASDVEEVLADPRVGLIVIATRHHEHAELVARSLAAGKHVFVEKPLAIDWAGLARVDEARSAAPAPLLMVGFNRRFSPAVAALAGAVRQRRGPLVMSYRVNAGYLPADHWIQGPQGGGRNIGEACHMYDVFRFLAGAPLASVAATAIDPRSGPYSRSENFSAMLGYEDGSMGSLVYTSLGPRGLAKERLEVFADGEAYLLDDYRSLTRASDAAVLWQAAEADKGHAAGLQALGRALASAGPGPTAYDELAETTAAALTIEELLHGRAA
jgi:predicted dehydrogenase/threonine dehydrogenase-like Zn-dependent dehydrogenase